MARRRRIIRATSTGSHRSVMARIDGRAIKANNYYPRKSHRGGRWVASRYYMALWGNSVVTARRSGLWGPGKLTGIFKRGR